MAMSLNRLTIIGNLTRDPEARTTTGGTNIVTFSVATNYKWKAKDSGEQKEEVEYHNVKAFGKVADIVMQYLKKGAKVYIEGRLRTEHWEDKTGTKKQRTVVMLESMLMLGKIKTVGKMITAQKESITKPLNLALKNVRLMFAPIDMGYGKAEEIVKEKMIAYQEAEEEKAAAKTKVIEEKVEAGTITPEKAFAKVEAITPKKNVTTATGAAQFRMVKEVEVEDETKVPREYMLLDMVKIRKVALAGVAIPGVRVFEKKVVAGIVK